jgi:hypothetical protein
MSDIYIFIIERHAKLDIKYPKRKSGRTLTPENIINPIVKTFQHVLSVCFLPLVSAKYPKTNNPETYISPETT